MLFNSLQFLWFFPTVVLIYFLTPHRHRWALLLIASYYFYMCWKAEYILLILASTLIDYVAALKMSRCETKKQRKKWLVLSLCSNLGMLFGFKYANFASQALRDALSTVNVFYETPIFDILLPVGISFYTFQTLSYTIDVYRGEREPQRHLGKFAVFVAFFPQLVAGPIERSKELLPQFDEIHSFDYARVKSGLKLMLWGFFKKLVIADQAALYVNAVHDNPERFGGLTLLIAAYLFAFQIYCDFSGYSDIAIGTSRVLGFRLMENFKRPYFSKSIREFWRRWHVSLSSWFRDYLYIPLGGNRGTTTRWCLVILIVFTTSGLWHGANWTYVAWGALHGFYLVAGRATGSLGNRLFGEVELSRARWVLDAGRTILTFHLAALAFVVFRASDIASAADMLMGIPMRFELSREAMLAGFSIVDFAAICLPIVFLNGIEIWQGNRTFSTALGAAPFPIRLTIYCILILGIACLGVFEGQEFIYFQF